jgi:type II secretory pathway component PulL
MNVKSPDVQILDSVKQNLKSKNYSAEIESANTQGNTVAAKLVVIKGDVK